MGPSAQTLEKVPGCGSTFNTSYNGMQHTKFIYSVRYLWVLPGKWTVKNDLLLPCLLDFPQDGSAWTALYCINFQSFSRKIKHVKSTDIELKILDWIMHLLSPFWLKEIVSRKLCVLFMVSLDRFYARGRAGSVIFFILMKFSYLNF
jgi:hypothetical protein